MKLDLDPRAEALPEFMAMCHAENHHWKRIHEAVTQTTRRGIVTALEVQRECSNCTALRVDEYALPSFELIRRSYKYPDGYRIRGEPRLSKQDFNKAYLGRALKELLK